MRTFLVGEEVLDLVLDAEGLELVGCVQDRGRRCLVMARCEFIGSLNVLFSLTTSCTPPLLAESLESAGGGCQVELLLGDPNLIRAVVEGCLEVFRIRE